MIQQTASPGARGAAGSFERNLNKWLDFASWMIWYPDLFLDLIRPKTGGIHLDPDQRVLIRSITRFYSVHGCFPRGYSKTLIEQVAAWIICIRYPNMRIALSAQTKENAASLLSDKTTEILRYYPMLSNELAREPRLQKNDAEILFHNGSRIDILANQQSSKGQRRERMTAEESALINAALFEDVLKPIVEVPRYTCGRAAVIDPFEVHQQINFFTTPAWRGSDEHRRVIDMLRNMIDLKGEMVLGASWMLSCWFGRGSTKAQILNKKKTMFPTTFDQNYGGRWTGASTGALVGSSALLACRQMDKPVLKSAAASDEFYLGVDVARSQSTTNNQSSIAVVRVLRSDRTGRIRALDLVNMIHISNTLNFTNQAIEVKRCRALYNAKMVIVDGNGLGVGLIDELLKDTIDPATGDSLGCWDTINTSNAPEVSGAEQCIFDLKSQSFQSKIISNFINAVDGQTLRLLQSKQNSWVDFDGSEQYAETMLPFIQTDLLFAEIINLRLTHNAGGGLGIEKVVNRIDKDRFSALSYALFYINEFEAIQRHAAQDISDAFAIRIPEIRRL